MSKILGIALVTAVTLGAIPASQAADMGKMQGKWSTWGCNVSWFDIGTDKVSMYSTQQKLPDNLVATHDAKISENGGKLDINYKYRGSDYKYVYDVKNNSKMLLDRLLVDDNVVFNRNLSRSPYRDRATNKCSPSA